MRNKKSAAKVLYQTAKTCQYVKISSINFTFYTKKAQKGYIFICFWLFIGVLLIVNWSQCPHCSRFPQSNLLNKNLKIIIKKFIEAILENYKKMHFFFDL